MTDSQNDLAQRVSALTAAQREVLVRQLTIDQQDPQLGGANFHLHGLVQLRQGGRATPGELLAHLKQKLPSHMVPREVVIVPMLPRTAAGKLDRDALLTLARGTAAGRWESNASPLTPRNEIEQVLAKIWCDVLGLSDVGVDEAFIELGGDSLLSIRILARVHQHGYRISPEDFFANPTIAGQAAIAQSSTTETAEQGLVTGRVELTPIQHWFFERIPIDQHHWNQSLLFRVDRATHLSTLERAVHALLLHHDALRISIAQSSPLLQRIEQPSAVSPVSELDLRHVAPDVLAASIEQHSNALNSSLELHRAPLLRVVLIRSPRKIADFLLIIAHHLIVDALSWNVLLEDLERACDQAEKGETPSLGKKTHSFKHWSRQLVEHAQSDAIRSELDYWLKVCAQPTKLVVDVHAPAHSNTQGSAKTVIASLASTDTDTVLRELPGVLSCRVNELLMCALAVALRRFTGTPCVRFDVEGHGRDADFEGVDVSRTIGWFTTVYPVALTLPPNDDPKTLLLQSKEQLRKIPHSGIGYGLLRELCDDESVRASLRRADRSALLFNYLGQSDVAITSNTRFVHDKAVCGTPRSALGQRAYLLEVNAQVVNESLQLHFSYCEHVHRESTILALANDVIDTIIAFLDITRGTSPNVHAPSDFPLANLDQSDLDDLAKALGALDEDT